MDENKVIESKPKSDEIDLLELFSRMGRSIKRFFTFIFKYLWIISFETFKFFYRNAIFIGLATIGGIIVGVAMFGVTKRYYASSMVANSNTLNNADIISYIDNLDNLCQAGDSVSLAQRLNLEVSDSKKIKSIKALWAYDLDNDGVADYIDYDRNYEIKDTSVRRIGNRFYVRAEVYDESVFLKLKKGLYDYIGKNPLVIELNKNRIEQAKQMIAKIDEEIRKLDSLQKFEYFQKDRIVPQVGANQLVLFTEKERKLYHNEIFALFNQRQSIEKSLQVYPDPITVIEDFTPLSQVVNKLSKFIIIWGLIGFIAGAVARFVWLYGVAIHKRIMEEEQ